jgi:hypothetical protein
MLLIGRILRATITGKGGIYNMTTQQIVSLNELRDELLREFMLASGNYKVEILSKIMDMDEELDDVKN